MQRRPSYKILEDEVLKRLELILPYQRSDMAKSLLRTASNHLSEEIEYLKTRPEEIECGELTVIPSNKKTIRIRATGAGRRLLAKGTEGVWPHQEITIKTINGKRVNPLKELTKGWGIARSQRLEKVGKR